MKTQEPLSPMLLIPLIRLVVITLELVLRQVLRHRPRKIIIYIRCCACVQTTRIGRWRCVWIGAGGIEKGFGGEDWEGDVFGAGGCGDFFGGEEAG